MKKAIFINPGKMSMTILVTSGNRDVDGVVLGCCLIGPSLPAA